MQNSNHFRTSIECMSHELSMHYKKQLDDSPGLLPYTHDSAESDIKHWLGH